MDEYSNRETLETSGARIGKRSYFNLKMSARIVSEELKINANYHRNRFSLKELGKGICKGFYWNGLAA